MALRNLRANPRFPLSPFQIKNVLVKPSPFQRKNVLIKSSSEEGRMKYEVEAKEWLFSLLIVWAASTINFKNFSILEKSKRYFDKCRPRFHIASQDR
jgi:hypothetical protein